ncbi:unnamed protein product [Toxocara canis]|uniref:Metalloendopeptidase n=1 Tax=Toxocara canis TaxID=6265 RepID=A0A183UT50_TOXCA|nr:unnamed protein product [Toxocara canis]
MCAGSVPPMQIKLNKFHSFLPMVFEFKLLHAQAKNNDWTYIYNKLKQKWHSNNGLHELLYVEKVTLEPWRAEIAAAIEDIERLTCIRIKPKTDADTDYVHIAPLDGCYSSLGRTGGAQNVSIDRGCVYKGTIVHELMHTIGFYHEQARADRDDYVTILWDNVMPGDEDQFDSYPLTEIDHLGTEYDYESVMHYSPKAFSKNGQPTILPKRAEVAIGHKEGLSATDAYKINRLYNCTTEAGPAKCEDLINDCDKILSSGLCDSQLLSEFVKKNCARTCKKCCIDKLSWCARAAEMQLCTKLPQEIPTYCPKSCRQC